MKSQLIPIYLILCLFPVLSFAQSSTQYFDGADTFYTPGSFSSSLKIEIDTANGNIWQIGSPQKTIFNSAATIPNVIITDTIQPYPTSDSSSFQYTIIPWSTWGILAIQWKQKLDMELGKDGGLVEFSIDGGLSWSNAFTDPGVYNFYGFNTANVANLPNGERGLTGVDSTWKDAWLCYDMSWMSFNDSLIVRHTFVSDSVQTNQEGWMLDNFLVHSTIIHTVNKVEQKEYMQVAPNPTTGLINIHTQKIEGFHIIEEMQLSTIDGKIIQQWTNLPTKYQLDISNQPSGIYLLQIQTNQSKETFKIVLEP